MGVNGGLKEGPMAENVLRCFHCDEEIKTTDEYLQKFLKDRNGKTETGAFHKVCLELFLEYNRNMDQPEYRVVGGEVDPPQQK
jgi:hypothetical protein